LTRGLKALFFSGPETLGPINLGNPNEFTMIQLAEKVIELTGSSSNIVFRELPSDDPKIRRPDIGKATRELDWTPTIQVDEGLSRTIKEFRIRL